MRSFLILLTLVLATGISGCAGSEPPTGSDSFSIPFGLTIPGNRDTTADYYATSGVTTRIVATRVGDSIVETAQTIFYGEFMAAPGVPLPTRVTINGNPLERHRGGDTLRLRTASGPSIYADNTWGLTDTDNSETTFTIPKIDVVDTIKPFDRRTTLRGDTSFTLQWKRPTLISSALYITWVAPNYTYEKLVADVIGEHVIPSEDMKKLRGKGKVVVTRYYYLPKKYKSRNLLLTRIAQRSFDVEVL